MKLYGSILGNAMDVFLFSGENKNGMTCSPTVTGRASDFKPQAPAKFPTIPKKNVGHSCNEVFLLLKRSKEYKPLPLYVCYWQTKMHHSTV